MKTVWYPWIVVWRRNIKVWQRLFLPSLIGNFGEPLIYLVALGFGLGSLIGELSGMPYSVFLASGIVCSSAMNTASFEGMYSAYTRMQMQKTWEAILTAPLSLHHVVFGEAVWCASKSLFSASAIILVATGLGYILDWRAVLALPIVFLLGFVFGSLALIVTSFAKSYDFFVYYFTLVLTPMMLLSGVFFPVSQFPIAIQWLASAFPLNHAVELIRPLLTGGAVQNMLGHLVVITAYAVVSFSLAIYRLRLRLQD